MITIRAFARLPRVPANQRVRWLLLVGGLTAVVFAFKQNAGVFLGLSAAVFLLLHGVDLPPPVVSPPLRAMQALGVAGLLAALVWLMWQHMDIVFAAYLLAPVAGVCLLALMGPVRRGGESLSIRLKFLMALAAGFACVTLPWILVLGLSQDGRFNRLGGFVGAVEQSGLFDPFHLPNGRHAAMLLGCGLVSVAAVRISRDRRWLLVVAAAWLVLVLLMVQAADPDQSLGRALLDAAWGLDSGFPLLLPSAAFWTGLWLARGRHLQGISGWQFRWYLAAGAFTFLTEYPISDL